MSAEEIVDRLYREANTLTRLPLMLELLAKEQADTFWKVFAEVWPGCDDTWNYRGEVLKQMRRRRGERPELVGDNHALFESALDNKRGLSVLRGCSLSKLRGLSWTTSTGVAGAFAKGHRGIPVAEPVIVSAFAPVEALFFVSIDREEGELVLDPKRLRAIKYLRILDDGSADDGWIALASGRKLDAAHL
jgi:hypothetical protein